MIRLDYAGVAGPDDDRVRVEASDTHDGTRIVVILPGSRRRAAQQLDALTDDLAAWIDLAQQRAEAVTR